MELIYVRYNYGSATKIYQRCKFILMSKKATYAQSMTKNTHVPNEAVVKSDCLREKNEFLDKLYVRGL